MAPPDHSVQSFKLIEPYAALAEPLLMENEALNCMGLSLLATLLREPRQRSAGLWVVERAGVAVAAAWVLPPNPLGFFALAEEALPALGRAIWASGVPLSGIYGPRPGVDQLKNLWLSLCGGRVTSLLSQGIYELTEVVAPPAVEGGWRLARSADEGLIAAWSVAFVRECGLSASAEETRRGAAVAVRELQRVVWVVRGRPVAMAGFGGRTRSGMRVSWVYTAPPFRGQGFAAALVAALSQHLLDQGCRACFLYTDWSNPTSNALYRRLGYRLVGQSAHYEF